MYSCLFRTTFQRPSQFIVIIENPLVFRYENFPFNSFERTDRGTRDKQQKPTETPNVQASWPIR